MQKLWAVGEAPAAGEAAGLLPDVERGAGTGSLVAGAHSPVHRTVLAGPVGGGLSCQEGGQAAPGLRTLSAWSASFWDVPHTVSHRVFHSEGLIFRGAFKD